LFASNKEKCVHCNGTGKVFASMSLNTGQAEYRTCNVCKGKGRVAADRSTYTTYPDKSVEIAQQLIAKHGSPQEVFLEQDSSGSFIDVRIVFANGSQYILGGFAVGYKGTRPDYLRELLNYAGFYVSADEIEKIRSPVHYEKDNDSREEY
jgi:hypothetical protein